MYGRQQEGKQPLAMWASGVNPESNKLTQRGNGSIEET